MSARSRQGTENALAVELGEVAGISVAEMPPDALGDLYADQYDGNQNDQERKQQGECEFCPDTVTPLHSLPENKMARRIAVLGTAGQQTKAMGAI